MDAISRRYEESYLRSRLKRLLPVTLITGSLGSGKTTLLRSLISMRGLDFKLGAIVNDFAEFNFDADVARISSDRVMELSNGCVCCSLANDLRSAVWKVLKSDKDDDPPDYLLVETSGVSDPTDIVMMLDECFGKMTRVVLESVVTVVDAEKILIDGVRKDDTTSIAQLRHADVILLNKIDLLEENEESKRQVLKVLGSISPEADIVSCTYCVVPLTKILPVRVADGEREVSGRVVSKHNAEYVLPSDLLESYTSYGGTGVRRGPLRRAVVHRDDAPHRHKNPNGSICFETEISFSLQRFQRLVYAIRNGKTPILSRMKGVVMFAMCPNVFYEFHLSGSTKRQRVQLIRLERPINRSRKTRIVAIGPGLGVKKNRELMSSLLQDCCCNPVDEKGKAVSSSWKRLICTDQRFEMSSLGTFFRLAVPQDMNRKDLSTRYGIDFDSLLDEFVRRVNMSRLPVLLLLNRLVLTDREDNGGGGELYAVSTCPLGYEKNEKTLLDTWSQISALSSVPIQRMLKQIPSCRCDI